MGKAKIIPQRNALLLPYQKKWVLDVSLKKVGEKPRQAGWTWCTGYGLVRRKSLKNAQRDAWISSRDDIQARLFLEDCKGFANILDKGAIDLGEKVIDDAKNTAYTLQMANALRIHSMSSNPDAQAGKRGDRVLDEFALHPDPKKLYSIAYPGVTWGGQIEIFSTHRGSANFFNQLIQEIKYKGNPKGFSLHTVTLQDVLDQGFLYKLQSKLPEEDPRQEMDEAEYFDYVRAGCPDEETFLQEYMCIPSDDASAFISYELIDGCKYAPGTDWETIGANPLYLGVDVGRDHDLTVFWLGEDVSGTLMTRKVITMKNATFDAQEEIFYGLLSLPNLRRCCIDRNGIGRQMAERAQKRYGQRKVEQVIFTMGSKEEMAYDLRTSLEDRTFRLPDDRLIASDFRAIRKTTTSSGNIRFEGERTKDGHSDRFWAAALCRHAKGKPNGPTFIPRTFTNTSKSFNKRSVA